jgi:hypothetical protein
MQRICTSALEEFKKASGPEHTSTLYAVHKLGDLYFAEGKMADAEDMH